jgi:hypothetical protein
MDTSLPTSHRSKDAAHQNSSYSIEYAHIYTDEKVNGNHQESIEALKEIKSASSSIVSTVVLIDDYNADSRSFSTDYFLERLRQMGEQPDFFAYESDLLPLADDLLSVIEKPKIERMYRSYIARKGKYPCSLLTATWYLVRLGRIDGSHILYKNSELSLDMAVADKLINILPSSFKGVEKDAHGLIGFSKFKDDRFKIEPVLFQEKDPVRGGFMPELV